MSTRKVIAQGSRARHGEQKRPREQKRVVVSFDDETFDQIRRRAVNENTSFAEQVRVLVEWGLMDEVNNA